MRLRELAAFVAIGLGGLAVPAAAQSAGDVEGRVQRLERAMQDLQGEIFRNGVPQGTAIQATGGESVGQAKLNDIEASLRQLTGQMEQLMFEVRTLKDRQDRFERDAQYRLLTLENGGTPPEGMAPPAETPPMPLANADTATAAGTYADATVSGPVTPLGPGATVSTTPPSSGTLGSIAVAPPAGGAEGLYNQGMDQLSRAQYADASASFSQILSSEPDSSYAPQAQFWIADINFVQKNYADAARGYAEMLKRYPDNSRSADAMLKLGLSLVQLGQTSEGCTTLGAIRAKYPNAGDTILSRAQRESKRAGCR